MNAALLFLAACLFLALGYALAVTMSCTPHWIDRWLPQPFEQG